MRSSVTCKSWLLTDSTASVSILMTVFVVKVVFGSQFIILKTQADTRTMVLFYVSSEELFAMS